MLTDFGGRISDETPIWVQGESNESEKEETGNHTKNQATKNTRSKAPFSSEDTAK